MSELKPALTYEEQLNHLITFHGLRIDDYEEAIAILKKVNYYRLSGYGIGLKRSDNKEKYQDNVSIRTLYRLYLFDSKLRNITMFVIENIEIQLRTQLAYLHSTKYGPEGYLSANNFNDKKNKSEESIHNNLITNFKQEIKRQNKLPFVIHHLDKYEGRFPFWVAIELFSFGNICSVYKILKSEDKKMIAELYKTEPDYLGSWILALVEIRNICAHYSRLYNMPLKQAPHLYQEYKNFRNKGQNKLFPAIITIRRMLNANTQWKEYFNSLQNLLEEYKDVVNFSYNAFPENWQSILS